MKEFLSQKGVPFTEKDVVKDQGAREEMINKSGQLAVPTIVVDGQVIVGFDRARLEKVLH